MKRLIPLTLFFLLVLCIACVSTKPIEQDTTNEPSTQSSPSAQDNPSCNLEYKGVVRTAVKLRPPGLSYPSINNGKPITVKEWFTLLQGRRYESLLRDKFPNDAAQEAEKQIVTLRARVLMVKIEDDNDLHIQVAYGKTWSLRNPQVIVEIPPGEAFCEARTTFEAILQADGGRVSKKQSTSRQTQIPRRYFFKNPPLIEFTGYLFLDAHHRRRDSENLWKDDGGRGVKNKPGTTLEESPVQGLWEIHPVYAIKLIED